jgi:hypothetical protein
MREMIRSIEDSQTEQALHGLLSLNSEMNMETLRSVSPNGGAAYDRADLNQLSVAALAMLLKQRGAKAGDPVPSMHHDPAALAPDNGNHGNHVAMPDGGGFQQQPGIDVVDSKRDVLKQIAAAAGGGVGGASGRGSPYAATEVVRVPLPYPASISQSGGSLLSIPQSFSQSQGSLLSIPQHVTLQVQPPQLIITTVSGGGNHSNARPSNHGNARSTDDGRALAAHHAQSVAATYAIPAYDRLVDNPSPNSVIVENMSLDLRKVVRSEDQVIRSPFKKRTYMPASSAATYRAEDADSVGAEKRVRLGGDNRQLPSIARSPLTIPAHQQATVSHDPHDNKV